MVHFEWVTKFMFFPHTLNIYFGTKYDHYAYKIRTAVIFEPFFMYHEANNIIGGLISIQLKNENFRFFEMPKYPKRKKMPI